MRSIAEPIVPTASSASGAARVLRVGDVWQYDDNLYEIISYDSKKDEVVYDWIGNYQKAGETKTQRRKDSSAVMFRITPGAREREGNGEVIPQGQSSPQPAGQPTPARRSGTSETQW